MTENSGIDLVDTVDNSLTFGDFGNAVQNCGTPICYFPYYSWWPQQSDSKVEKAYTIVRALMKAKVVRVNTLEKFFELMDEVVKVV
jgi:hypothetical protein